MGGTPGMEHRIGGLEKQNITGNVNYEPDNHDFMVRLRQEKVDNIAKFIPDLEVDGEQEGDILVLGWGGTYGAITEAVKQMRKTVVEKSEIIDKFGKGLQDLRKNNT